MASEETAKAQLDLLSEIAGYMRSQSEAQQQEVDLQQREAADAAVSSSGPSPASTGGSSGFGGAGVFNQQSIGRFSEFASDPFQSKASKSFAMARAVARSSATVLGLDDSYGDAVYNASGIAQQQRIHQDAESAARGLLTKYAAAGGTVTPELSREVFRQQREQAQRIGDANATFNRSIGAVDAIDGVAAGLGLGREISNGGVSESMLTELRKMNAKLDQQRGQ